MTRIHQLLSVTHENSFDLGSGGGAGQLEVRPSVVVWKKHRRIK